MNLAQPWLRADWRAGADEETIGRRDALARRWLADAKVCGERGCSALVLWRHEAQGKRPVTRLGQLHACDRRRG